MSPEWTEGKAAKNFKCWVFTTYVKWDQRAHPRVNNAWCTAEILGLVWIDFNRTTCTFSKKYNRICSRLENELYLRENEFCKKWPHSPTSRLKVIWHRYNSPKWSQMYQIHQPFLRTSFMISYPHPVWGIPFNNSWLMVEKTYLVWCFLTMSWPYIGEYTVIRSISAPFLRNIQHLEKLQKQITIAVTAKTLSFRMSQPESHFRHGEEGAKADGASHGRFSTMTVRESVWQRKGSAFHNSSAIVSWDQTHYFCNPLNVPRRKMWCVNLSDPRSYQPLQDFHDFWLPLILNFSEAGHVPYTMGPAPFATLVGAWTKAGSCQVLALSKKGNTTIVQVAWSWVYYIF